MASSAERRGSEAVWLEALLPHDWLPKPVRARLNTEVMWHIFKRMDPQIDCSKVVKNSMTLASRSGWRSTTAEI